MVRTLTQTGPKGAGWLLPSVATPATLRKLSTLSEHCPEQVPAGRQLGTLQIISVPAGLLSKAVK